MRVIVNSEMFNCQPAAKLPANCVEILYKSCERRASLRNVMFRNLVKFSKSLSFDGFISPSHAPMEVKVRIYLISVSPLIILILPWCLMSKFH